MANPTTERKHAFVRNEEAQWDVSSTTESGSQVFWEIQAGAGGLTKAMARAGWATRKPLEAMTPGGWDQDQDLGRKEVRAEVWKVIKEGKLDYVHFGICCRTWTILGRLNGMGRDKASPWGNENVAQVKEANIITAFLVRCVLCLHKRGVAWSVENPASSYLWCLPALRRLKRSTRVTDIYVDQCEFGLAYPEAPRGTYFKKPTRILTNWLKLECLGRRCSGDHEHIDIRGNMVLVKGRRIKRSAAAGTYPPALCRTWARLASA